VDLCSRLHDCGYRIVWTPFAELLYTESAYRGDDETPDRRARRDSELAVMCHGWGPELRSDPFHNPNISFRVEQFRIGSSAPASGLLGCIILSLLRVSGVLCGGAANPTGISGIPGCYELSVQLGMRNLW
jgi:hypothetical protein